MKTESNGKYGTDRNHRNYRKMKNQFPKKVDGKWRITSTCTEKNNDHEHNFGSPLKQKQSFSRSIAQAYNLIKKGAVVGILNLFVSSSIMVFCLKT